MNNLAVVQDTAIVTPALKLERLIGAFIEAQDVSPSSRDTYGRQLRQFILWLEETGRACSMNTLTRQDILSYKDYLHSSGKSVLSANGYLTAVRKLFCWLESEKVYPDIAKGVKGFKKPQSFNKDCLTKEQLQEALKTLERGSLEGVRDFALFNLMARTGLRDVEIARAKVEDIRQESGSTVLWIQGKGRDSKDAFVVLTPKAERPLRQWLSIRGKVSDSDPLFCSLSDKNYGQPLTTRSISRIVKEALRRVGLDSRRLTAHSLRHTAITLAIKGGASIEQAQAMARHSDPRTTMVYFHNLNRVQDGAEKYIDF